MRNLTGHESTGPLRIDRKTKWGNPFTIGRDGTRAEVIAKYRKRLWRKINNGEISIKELAELRNRDVLC